MLRGHIYYVRLQLNGRELWRSTGHTTLPSAIRKADEIKVSLRNTRDWQPTPAVPTFATWGHYFQLTFAPAGRYYKPIIERAINTAGWASRRLDKFTLSICQDYINRRRKHAKPHYVHLNLVVLKRVFTAAVDEGVISKNPWDKVKGVSARERGPRMRVLTHDHEATLRAVLSPRWNRWLTYMLGTGLRISEACAITPDLLDYAGSLLTVPDHAAKGGIGRPVPIFPHVAPALQAQVEAEGMLWPLSPGRLAHILQEKAKLAGIPHLSPHDLRHTFATRYLQGGGDIYHLSKILGHASVTITERVYAHLLKEDLVKLSANVDWSPPAVATDSATPARKPNTAA